MLYKVQKSQTQYIFIQFIHKSQYTKMRMNAWTFCLLIPRCNILVLSVFTNTHKNYLKNTFQKIPSH